MGYEQALARVNELRGLSSGVPTPAASQQTNPAAAALFQQQMLAANGSAGSTDPSMASMLQGSLDPYAALQGGGLSTQAALMQQMGIGQTAAPTSVRGKTDGLEPQLLQRLDALGRELGQPIDVISGNRTYQEQAELYQKYLNGTGNLAAPPGHSNHEQGAAADAYVNGVALANVPGAREAAARLGLHFPVGGEAWHVERSDR